MVQTARSLRFLVETPFVFVFFVQRQTEINGLDRNHTVDQRVACLVDDTHGPLAKLVQNFVASKMTNHRNTPSIAH